MFTWQAADRPGEVPDAGGAIPPELPRPDQERAAAHALGGPRAAVGRWRRAGGGRCHSSSDPLTRRS